MDELRDDIRDEITSVFRSIMNDEQELTHHRLRAAELLGIVWGVLEDDDSI